MRKPTLAESIMLIAAVAIVLGVTVVPAVWSHFRRGSILESGVPARARILEMHETGERLNSNPVVRFRLSVALPDGGDFESVLSIPVPPEILPRLRPGVTIGVIYDPKKRRDVAIAAPK